MDIHDKMWDRLRLSITSNFRPCYPNSSYISLHSFPQQDSHLRGLGVPQKAPCQDPADLADVQSTPKEMTDDGYTRAVVPSVQDKTRVSYVMDAIINFLIMKSYQRHQNL